MGTRGALTIDECVENVLAVLLHQVIDVSKNSTGRIVSLCPAASPLLKAGQRAAGNLPHGELERIVARESRVVVGGDGNWRRRAGYGGEKMAEEGRGAKERC